MDILYPDSDSDSHTLKTLQFSLISGFSLNLLSGAGPQVMAMNDGTTCSRKHWGLVPTTVIILPG